MRLPLLLCCLALTAPALAGADEPVVPPPAAAVTADTGSATAAAVSTTVAAADPAPSAEPPAPEATTADAGTTNGAANTASATDPAPATAPAANSTGHAAADGSNASALPADVDWINREEFDQQLKKVQELDHTDPKAGLFGPGSMMWQMTRYMAPGGFGAGTALLLQISHPWITAGIDEHSVTRTQPLKRARDTFSYILTMIYGDREQALQAARDVRLIHNKVKGRMPYSAGRFAKGTEYRANEVGAMVWVQATLWDTLVHMYEESVGPVSDYDKARFYEETKLFAMLFGIPRDALPKGWWDFETYCERMRNEQLVVTPASKDLEGFLFGVHSIGGAFLWLPMQYEKVVTAANLPEKLRDGYGLGYGPVRGLMYSTGMATSRGLHHVLPDFLLENPVYKEARARLRGERAWPLTRFELWLAFGHSRLTNHY
jgi:uncharacterized protein (DUF2236 family)